MPTESSADGRSIEVNGAMLHVEEHGSGTPLILIHGALSSGRRWDAVWPHLIGDCRVIVPDSRGHGRSTNPTGKLSYTQLADDVAALIEALGLVRPVVGGHSDGGQVTLELGARHPNAANALIAAAPHHDFDAGLREVWRAFLGLDDAGNPDFAVVDATLGDFADVFKSWHPGGDEQWRAVVQQTAGMWLDYAGLSNDEVGRLETAVLLVAGDRDAMIPLERTVALYQALPDAELAVCPGTGHSDPMSPERAALFAALIRDFTARHSYAP